MHLSACGHACHQSCHARYMCETLALLPALLNQSISQSIKQSIHQSINQLINLTRLSSLLPGVSELLSFWTLSLQEFSFWAFLNHQHCQLGLRNSVQGLNLNPKPSELPSCQP